MRESVVQKTTVKWAVENGWLTRKIRYEGRNSAPDRFFVKNAVVVFIEFKRPGGQIRPGQRLEIPKLKRKGALAFVFDNSDSAIALLDSFG